MTSETMNKMLAVVMGLASVPVAACGGSPPPAPVATPENTATAVEIAADPTSTAEEGCLPLIEKAAGGTVAIKDFYDQPTIEDQASAECCQALAAADPAGMKLDNYLDSGCCEVIGGDAGAFCTPWGPAMPPAMTKARAA